MDVFFICSSNGPRGLSARSSFLYNSWQTGLRFGPRPGIVILFEEGAQGMLASHGEQHRTKRIGWLRAAVLGANDGILSTASLVLGVAAAHGTHSNVLVAGVAGWLLRSRSRSPSS